MFAAAFLSVGLSLAAVGQEDVPGKFIAVKLGGPRSVSATVGDLIRVRGQWSSAPTQTQKLRVTIDGEAATKVAVIHQPIVKNKVAVSGAAHLDAYISAAAKGTSKVTIFALDAVGKEVGKYSLDVKVSTEPTDAPSAEADDADEK
jgi:hypothetical protein